MTKVLIFLMLSFSLLAQQEYNQWRFGYGAGIDFNSGSPIPVSGSSIFSQESAASVADCFGNLLFYTDGETIWSNNDGVMEGGTGLNGLPGRYPSTQGSLIVKRPQSSSIYYVFTASDIYGLNYSVVNMAANNGLGRVIQKNVKVSSGLTHKLAVTYHENEIDIWVLTHYENSSKYEAFLVTQTGVSSTSVVSETGPSHTSAHGEMKVNRQGTKVAAVVQDQDLVTLADFDNATGEISNAIGILDVVGKPHGCEFSATGNKMYVTGWGAFKGGVYQFTVGSSNSNTLTIGRTNISGSFKPLGSLQLAPDNKIYVAHDPDLDLPGNRFLGIIHNPENDGDLASFQREGLNLGTGFSSWQLPNVTLTSNEIYEDKSILSSNYCVNEETAFSLSNTSGVVDVLWDFDDPSSGVDNYSNNQEAFHQYSTPGTYTVKVTVTTTCEVKDYFETIVINDGPESNLGLQNICANTDYLIGGETEFGVTYSWMPDVGLNNNTLANPRFNSSGLTQDTFNIIYTATTLGGCVTVDTLSLYVLPQEGAVEDQTLCPGFGVTLGVDSGVVNALWDGVNISDNQSLSPFVSPTVTSVYTASLTDTNGCLSFDTVLVFVSPIVPLDAGESSSICYGDSIVIGNNISPDSTLFQWSPELNVEFASEGETNAFPEVSSWFYLTATNDTCSSTDSVFITVHDLPEVELNPKDSVLCQKEEIEIKASGALIYSWESTAEVTENTGFISAIADSSFIVIVEGIDSNNCVSVDTSSIGVLPLPQPVLTNDTAVCEDQPITLRISGGVSYRWLNGSIAGLTDSVITFVSLDENQTFFVEVTGENGCNTLDTVVVMVDSLPKIIMMSDTLICEGGKAFLWASGAEDYSWSPSNYLNETTGDYLVAVPEDSITYKVVGTDGNGCIDSAEASIQLNINPTVGFTYDYTSTCAGFEVQFSDSSLNAESYNWQFGDGNTSTEQSPFYVYKFGSNLITSLIVGNNDLCFDTLSVPFYWQKISEFIDVFAPNIITPNNDALNDCFEIRVPAEFENCTHYSIFNRWGMKVFDSDLFDGQFCGVSGYNNQAVSEGTYYYVMEVGDYILNGFIQVIR